MSVISKSEDPAQAMRAQQTLDLLGPCTMLIVAESAMLVSARTELARSITGNKAATIKLLTSSMSLGALLEFISGPTIGKLTDLHGRKSALIACAAGISLSRFLVSLMPRSKALFSMDRILSMAMTMGFFSTIRAVQADLISDDERLAMAAARVGRWAGLGAFAGPFLNALFVRFGGNPRYSFFGAALVSGLAACVINSEFIETVRKQDERPFVFADVNPFSFLKLFYKTDTVRVLMTALLLQSFGDGKNLLRVNSLFMRGYLKWSKLQVSNMLAASGAAVVIGGFFSDESITQLGIRGHTSFSNFCQFVSSIIWALTPSSSPWSHIFPQLSLLTSIGAHRKRDGIESIITRLAAKEKVGNGQINAMLSNWKSLATISAPVLFGSTYSWATDNPKSRYFPGLPYLILAAFSLLAENAFQQLSDDELGLKTLDLKKGDVLSTEKKVTKVRDMSNRGKVNAATKPIRAEPSKRSDVPEEVSVSSDSSCFLTKERQKLHLAEKVEISHDTKLFRFQLPDKDIKLGLPVGKHIKFWCPNPKPVTVGEWNGREDPESSKGEIERKYTPSSSDDDLGRVDVIVKVYQRGVNEKFPDGGKMSQHLNNMSIGDSIDVAGPFGIVEYKGNGTFAIRRKMKQVKFIGMIAGGTGITPMLQLIKAVLKDPADSTKMALLFANQTEEDILLRDMLERLAEAHPTRFKVWYTLDRPPKDWDYSTGFIDSYMISSHLPPPSSDSIVLMCGPPPMIKYACKPNLEKLGYEKDSYVEF